MLLSLLLLFGVCCGSAMSFMLPTPFSSSRVGFSSRTSTTLFAHHVNKKITKRMMDRRPKKTRPSDINRNNINHGKCITKMDLGPDYTLLPAADFDEHHQANMLRFWEEGSPDEEWIELTEEDLKIESPSTCQEAPPNDGTPKNPPIRKNGWGRG